MCAGKHRIDLADGGLLRFAQVQGNVEGIDRLLEFSQEELGHAQVEARKRMLGPVLDVEANEKRITLSLALLALRTSVIAAMHHVQRAALDHAAVAVYAVENLLVDPALEAQLGQVAEELHVVYNGEAVLAGSGRNVHLHHDAGYPVLREQHGLVELASALLRNGIVGVDP